MRKLRAALVRLGGWFGKARRERELTAEFESHLRLHIDDNLRLRREATQLSWKSN